MEKKCIINIYLLNLQVVGALKRTADNIKDPLFRFFEREVNLGAKLLQDIRQDLQDVMLICQGDKKPTNHHRSMMADLSRGRKNFHKDNIPIWNISHYSLAVCFSNTYDLFICTGIETNANSLFW